MTPGEVTHEGPSTGTSHRERDTMTPREYLQQLIESQTLAEDSPELKALRKRRDEIEAHLREAFGSSPNIRYGGSQAKGTLVRDSYDLDLVCYFPRDESDAGD